MTPEEMLAAKGVYAGPSKEGKSYYIVHGKDGKKQKIPMSEGVTGLEDASGRFPEHRDRVYSLREAKCQVMGRGALSGIVVAARSVKRRFFG
jgi:hypothetical protein